MQKHIIDNRYASIYSAPMPGYRDGASSPVVFVERERKYHGFITCPILGHHHCERPHTSLRPHVMEAGQYGSGYPAVLSH